MRCADGGERAMVDPYYVQPDDELEDMQAQLKRALALSDADFARLSPEVRNLFAARRHLGHSWLDDYEVVVEVVSNPGGCGCGVAPGQRIVLSMRHAIKPELSDAPLCVHLLSPILSIFYMTFDRAQEGLNPLTPIWRFHECPHTGEDNGASKARCRVFLRRADTHEVVDARILPGTDPGAAP